MCDLRNVEEIILCRSDVEELPKSFTSNLQNVMNLNFERSKLFKVPENMCKLLHLQRLNISYNKFTSLSDDICSIVSLQYLNAASNKITFIPSSISQLANLQHLNISTNSLSEIPDEISELVNLEVLNVSNNNIKYLPVSMGQLKQLMDLNVSVNHITVLPKEFTFYKLKTLNLSHNVIVNIPDCLLVNLHNVSFLDLSRNRIVFFDTPPKCVSKLVSLDLSYNAFSDIPSWIFGRQCKMLIELNISNNKNMIGPCDISGYSKRGEKIGVASCLKYLNASNCCFTSSSLTFLHGLEALEELILGNSRTLLPLKYGNILYDFPSSTLSTCKRLKHVNLNGVTLADLPESIGCFSESIQTLDLSSNSLQWLPASFCHLSTLTILQISHNQLVLLPPEFGDLTSLVELQLDGNKLQSLPESFAKLCCLKLLDLYDNLFDELPEVVMTLQNLDALDLEWNCFAISAVTCPLDEEFVAKYTRMKDNLRFRMTPSSCPYIRCNCAKPEFEESSEDNKSNCFSDSEIEEEEGENDLDGSNVNCASVWLDEGFTITNGEEEENWDTAGDMDDDNFDPTFSWKKCLVTPIKFVEESDEEKFVPHDIHCAPLLRPRNTSHIFVEGQFEDADET